MPVTVLGMGALKEFVLNCENDYLFEVRSTDDLYSKIRMVIDDPALINELKRNIRSAKDVEQNAEEITRIYSNG